MINKSILLITLLMLFSCVPPDEEQSTSQEERSNSDLEDIWNVDFSSDSLEVEEEEGEPEISALEEKMIAAGLVDIQSVDSTLHVDRSEERRVGKECRS